MDLFTLIIGVILGAIFSSAFLYFYFNSKFIAKNDYETLSFNLQEITTALKICQSNLENQFNLNHELKQLNLLNDSEITQLQKQNAIFETLNKNYDVKFDELYFNLKTEKEDNLKLQKELIDLNQKKLELSVQQKNSEENYIFQKQINEKQLLLNEQLTEKIQEITSKYTEINAENINLQDKLTSQKETILQLQETAHLQFEKIANKIFEDKSEKFSQSNKTNIESILKPLSENIANFKQKVEETYEKESKQRFSLEDKVKELIEQTNKISSEANNLASALKGQNKKQGNWGEMILESILENSGLIKDLNYTIQETITKEGKQFRPDILVKLPENRIIIIDSKVSLSAYEQYNSSENNDEQKIFLNNHLISIYKHIDDLSGKKYDDLEDSLDFSMMFIPIEPAYLIAIQSDNNLWNYAYKKRILLISPTNLIACLKLISDLWKRELQSKNAMEIVKRGELMYEKFVNFSETLDELGKNLEKSNHNYQKAINQLTLGSGNLVSQALNLRKLGLKSSKEIPNNLLGFEEDI